MKKPEAELLVEVMISLALAVTREVNTKGPGPLSDKREQAVKLLESLSLEPDKKRFSIFS